MQEQVREQNIVRQENPNKLVDYQKPEGIRWSRVIGYIVGVIEVILAARFVLKLLGANPASGFVDFIYAITYPFVLPFLGIFRNLEEQELSAVLEWSTLVAMAVYGIVAFGIQRLVILMTTKTDTEVQERVTSEQKNIDQI